MGWGEGGLPIKQEWVSYTEEGSEEWVEGGQGQPFLPLPLPDHSLNLDSLPHYTL